MPWSRPIWFRYWFPLAAIPAIAVHGLLLTQYFEETWKRGFSEVSVDSLLSMASFFLVMSILLAIPLWLSQRMCHHFGQRSSPILCAFVSLLVCIVGVLLVYEDTAPLGVVLIRDNMMFMFFIVLYWLFAFIGGFRVAKRTWKIQGDAN